MGWLNKHHREEPWYDIAQICLNGHVITSRMRSSPARSAKRCAICGEVTIAECPNCNASIRGFYHVPGVIDLAQKYRRPAFCHECGAPYPWTERRLVAAKDLAYELEALSDEERQLLAQSLDDIVRDTPKTSVAAGRFKRLVAKAGGVAAEAFKDILTDIASETAKKMIWG